MRPDGRHRWLRVRAIPIRDADGRIIRIAGITEDVTDRMRAAEMMEATRKHAARLVEALHESVGVLSHTLALESASGPHDAESFALRAATLTPRQREVMELLVDGRSSKTIADTLAVSARTVEAHWSQVMKKLRVGSVAGLIRLVLTARLRDLT